MVNFCQKAILILKKNKKFEEIGKMLNEGIGVPKNSKQALNYFLKSAKNNYVNSQFMVGYLFLSGEGGISDPFRARVWAEIADTNKYPDAKLLAEYSEYKLDQKKVAKAKMLAQTCIKTFIHLSHSKSEKQTELNKLNELKCSKTPSQKSSYAAKHVFLYLHAQTFIKTFIYLSHSK